MLNGEKQLHDQAGKSTHAMPGGSAERHWAEKRDSGPRNVRARLRGASMVPPTPHLPGGYLPFLWVDLHYPSNTTLRNRSKRWKAPLELSPSFGCWDLA
jgi:hypothetical protein